MHAQLFRDAEGDRVVVRCDDRVSEQALLDLYFLRGDDGYAKRFPSGSVTDAILARLREVLVPLLRQTARLEPAPWQGGPRGSVRGLQHAGIRRGVGGEDG